MAELFKPDIFSETKPVFSDISFERTEEIKSLFEINYGFLDTEVNRVRKFGGIEINSNNFRIETDKGQFILKIFDDLSENELAAIEKQHALMGWLYMKEVSCPRPQIGKRQVYVNQIEGGKYISLLHFVDGKYFPGKGSPDIRKTGEAVGKFHVQLKRAPIELKPNRQYPHLSDLDKAMFERVIFNLQNELPHFPEQQQVLLVDNQNLLAQVWDKVLSYQDAYLQSEHEFVHIDIHPHNVIMNEEGLPIFLDFDSLMQAPIKMMLAFSAYKLLRQFISSSENERAKEEMVMLTEQYLEGVFNYFPELRLPTKSLAIYAYTEICRRIAYILRLNILENNHEWNHVLAIQISGLCEVGFLFGVND